MKNSCFCHFEDYWIQSDLYGELKGDFKQRKKSTISKPATNNHGEGNQMCCTGRSRSIQLLDLLISVTCKV